MSAHHFRIVNVFTRDGGALTGNPLCVFERGEGLGTATMQALARQFNLSETTFILPASRAGADAGVRIFTPSYEMPFAGHPTLGTAHVCRALGLGGDELVLDMPAGLVPVKANGRRWTLTAPSPISRELEEPLAALASALGLSASDLGDRPLWMKAGREQLIVPLASADAVRRAAPQMEDFGRIRSHDGPAMAYVFALDGRGGALSRFFFPDGPSMLEDPATGSATANFGGWWLAMQRPLPVQLRISQGEQVGRPSTLLLEVSEQRKIYVAGEVLELGRGVIELG